MGVNHSHSAKKIYNYKGFVTIHNEKITRNLFCFKMTYLKQEGECEEKIVVTKRNKNTFKVAHTHDGTTDKRNLTRIQLLEMLDKCAMNEELKFMTDYLNRNNI
jgi:hypothetical protein